MPTLLREDADAKWREIYDRILLEAGREKVVLFAQPIETVTALSRFLEKRTGSRPAMIVGNQDEEDRQRNIDEFWKPTGPQFLISSRAGGEGLNLQVARRLVHVDVPWNPMEMEQRVGRIHRFMSRRKIVIDTVVVKDSREVHAYGLARDKLRAISSTLVPQERFDALFSRVMALVAPDDFQEILQERPLGPLNDEEQRRVSQLVTQGFDRWRELDRRYSTQQKQIRLLDAGEAKWPDIAQFAREYLRAKTVDGYSSLRFRWSEEEVEEASEEALVFDLGEEQVACGDYGGMPVSTDDGRTAGRLGLNHPMLATALRRNAFPEEPAGAAHIRWPAGKQVPVDGVSKPFGVIVLARQSVRWQGPLPVEAGTALNCWVVSVGREPTRVDGESKGELMRTLLSATQRQEAEPAESLIAALRLSESCLITELRRPSDADRASGISHAVFPLLAAVVS